MMLIGYILPFETGYQESIGFYQFQNMKSYLYISCPFYDIDLDRTAVKDAINYLVSMPCLLPFLFHISLSHMKSIARFY